MVLIKVGELIVEKDGGLKICRNIELKDALFLVGHTGDGSVLGVIDESIARSPRVGVLLVFCTQPI